MKVSFNQMVSNNSYANVKQKNKNNSTSFKGDLGIRFVRDVMKACNRECYDAKAKRVSEEIIKDIKSSFFTSLQKLKQFTKDRLLSNTTLDSMNFSPKTDHQMTLVGRRQEERNYNYACFTETGYECNPINTNGPVYFATLSHTKFATVVNNLINNDSFYDYSCVSKWTKTGDSYLVPYMCKEKPSLEDWKNLMSSREAFIEELKRTNTPTKLLNQFIRDCQFEKLARDIDSLEKKEARKSDILSSIGSFYYGLQHIESLAKDEAGRFVVESSAY